MTALRCWLAIVLLCVCATAHAQMQNEMTRMFNEQGNVTNPAIVQGNTRTVVTMGGVTVKSPIVRTDDLGLHLEMPSASAGCGGIDIQGGYLSLPSTDRFVDIARAVAANAKGYAFKLALGAICSQCEGLMSAIQDKINAYSIGAKNSCELAQSIMDSTGVSGGIQEAARRAGAGLNQAAGRASDWYEASGEESGVNPARDAYQKTPEKMKELTVGNFVWDALKKSDFGSWFGSSNSKALRESMMSISGSVIACIPGEGGCAPVDGDPDQIGLTIIPLLPQLALKDLVKPASESNAKVWRCNNDDCFSPKEEAISNQRSITDEIKDVYLGTVGVPGYLDLVKYAPDEAAPLTDQQKPVVAATGDIGKMAVALAIRSSVEDAKNFIDTYAHVAAARFVYRYSDDSMRNLEQVLSRDSRPPAAQALAAVREARRKLAADYAEINSEVSADSQRFTGFVQMLQAGAPQSLLYSPQ